MRDYATVNYRFWTGSTGLMPSLIPPRVSPSEELLFLLDSLTPQQIDEIAMAFALAGIALPEELA